MNKFKKHIPLVVAVIVIVGLIAFLESKKVQTAPVDLSNSIIPVDVNGLGSATSTATTSAAANTSQQALATIIQEKSQKYDRARELTDPSAFINTDPFTIKSLIGKKVILVDFWTYSCINCQRTLPYVTSWYQKYKDLGLVIIGVHSPEFEFEKNIDNVKRAVAQYGITYPVVMDNDLGTWNAYQNRFWPSEYLIDIDGFIVDNSIGEGNYDVTERKIQAALQERQQRLGLHDTIPTNLVSKSYTIDTQSPETYFGSARNEYFGNGNAQQTGTQTLTLPQSMDMNKFYLDGTWDFQGEYATTKSAAKIVYKYDAKDVYIVASSDQPVTVNIIKDGVPAGQVTIQNSGLYPLIQDSAEGTHTLELDIPSAGLNAFTFTFG